MSEILMMAAQCPVCRSEVHSVTPIRTAGQVIALPCGHNIVAERRTDDPPGMLRMRLVNTEAPR